MLSDKKINPSLPILIVDDDEVALISLATTLRTIGIANLRIVSNSTTVPAMLALEAFSLVLLDLNMPGLSGYEILERTKELSNPPPFIIITGSLPPPEFVIRLLSDVADYLLKPVDRDRLLEAVSAVLNERS